MGLHDEDPDRNRERDAMPQVQERPSTPRIVPSNDARGRILPITPEEQARNAMVIAAFIERMQAMPDEDPRGRGK